MSKSVKINGVTYSDVPSVSIPLSSGSGNATFFDTSSATVTAGDLRNGVKAFDGTGEVQGTLAEISGTTTNITTKAQTVSISAGIHDGTGKVQISSTEQAKIIASNIKSGVTILGVAGGLTSATISQNGTTKVLTIS